MKKIFSNKKGIESLIAWVLLIGFSVGLAVFVTRWSLQQAQKSTSGVEEMVMGDIQCSDVAISGHCDENNNIIIKNKGTLNIIGYKKGSDTKPTMFSKEDILKPNVGELKFATTKISITPIINIDGKQVMCVTQKQDFECKST